MAGWVGTVLGVGAQGTSGWAVTRSTHKPLPSHSECCGRTEGPVEAGDPRGGCGQPRPERVVVWARGWHARQGPGLGAVLWRRSPVSVEAEGGNMGLAPREAVLQDGVWWAGLGLGGGGGSGVQQGPW